MSPTRVPWKRSRPKYATRLLPVYPATAKVSSWAIERMIGTALARLEIAEDALPTAVGRRTGLMGQPLKPWSRYTRPQRLGRTS